MYTVFLKSILMRIILKTRKMNFFIIIFCFGALLLPQIQADCNSTGVCENTCQAVCSNQNVNAAQNRRKRDLPLRSNRVEFDPGNNQQLPVRGSSVSKQKEQDQPIIQEKSENLPYRQNAVQSGLRRSKRDFVETLPERPNRVVLNPSDQSVQLPQRSNVFPSQDQPVPNDTPVGNNPELPSRKSALLTHRAKRDDGGEILPERSNRVTFDANDKNVELPLRANAVLSQDQPFLRKQDAPPENENKTPSENEEETCRDRCLSICQTQIAESCSEICAQNI